MIPVMTAPNARAKAWRPSFAPIDAQPAQRRCDHPGCAQEGEFRAPQARDRLNDYYWFCLDHVREYNAAWNYYAGMSADEIEAETRKDTTWQRPTWPLGLQGAKRPFHFTVHDPFDLMDKDKEDARARAARPPTPEEEALAVLELTAPVTPAQVKARYKEMVKLHHPDANNGDKGAEERFKRINQAYNTLRKSFDEA
jgi:hypothetical protein